MTDQSTRYTLNQPQCHTFLMGILSVNNCGVFQRYNGNDLKFNLREPTRIDFRCNRYITSFVGIAGIDEYRTIFVPYSGTQSARQFSNIK